MTTIEYFGINPNATELLNSKEFRSVLETYPELSLVTVEEEHEYAKGHFYKVELPLPEDHDENIAIIDVDDRGTFMWILNEDLCFVNDPSPAFIEILRVMDAFAIETLDARLFMSQDSELCEDDPEILSAKYNFTIGEYIL